MRRSGPRGGPQGRNLIDWNGSYRDVIVERSTVHVQVAADPFWVIRGCEDGGIVGWYINLAAPWTRFALGFDTEDHVLDVVVADDRSSWSWKDEDELAWMVERGSYAPERAVEIRRNGEAAIDRLERREPPFDDATWSGIVIDPAGPIPVLPEGWQVPSSRRLPFSLAGGTLVQYGTFSSEQTYGADRTRRGDRRAAPRREPHPA